MLVFDVHTTKSRFQIWHIVEMVEYGDLRFNHNISILTHLFCRPVSASLIQHKTPTSMFKLQCPGKSRGDKKLFPHIIIKCNIHVTTCVFSYSQGEFQCTPWGFYGWIPKLRFWSEVHRTDCRFHRPERRHKTLPVQLHKFRSVN